MPIHLTVCWRILDILDQVVVVVLRIRVSMVAVEVVDKAALIPTWVRDIRRGLGLGGQVRIFAKVLRRWGWRGLRDVLESERIFQSRYTGYAIIVGRKPP